MTKQNLSALNVILVGIAIIVATLFMILSYFTYFADSEIWLLTLSQNVFQPSSFPSIYYKWIFHLFTYAMSHFAPSEEGVYLMARLGWGLIALLTIFLTARLFSRVYKNSKLFWPLVTVLLTSSVFLNQGFRIRGDILSLFFHIAYLSCFWHILEGHQQKRNLFSLILINGLLALTTPKFLLYLPAQILLCGSWALQHRQHKKLFWWITVSHSFAPIGISLIALITPLFNYLRPLDSIASAADFYLKSFNPEFVNADYFSSVDFYHVLRFVERSPVHGALIGLWLLSFFVMLFHKPDNGADNTRPLQAYAGALLFMVLTHNQKLPFFLGPFITPVLAQSFSYLSMAVARYKPTYSIGMATVVSFICLNTGGSFFFENITANINGRQRELIRRLDAYASDNPQVKIYDIIGLLPRKNKIFIFVGPSEVAQKDRILNEINRAQPDMILLTYKFTYLQPEFVGFLEKNWVPISKDVWVRGEYYSPALKKELFGATREINGKHYWIIPDRTSRSIIDTMTYQDITPEVLRLDQHHQPTQLGVTYLAVPASYLTFVFTPLVPLTFSYSPSVLFRYDTSF